MNNPWTGHYCTENISTSETVPPDWTNVLHVTLCPAGGRGGLFIIHEHLQMMQPLCPGDTQVSQTQAKGDWPPGEGDTAGG